MYTKKSVFYSFVKFYNLIFKTLKLRFTSQYFHENAWKCYIIVKSGFIAKLSQKRIDRWLSSVTN